MKNHRQQISTDDGTSECLRAHGRARRRIRDRVRRVVGAATLTASLFGALSVVGPAPAAQAQITSATATMQCGAGAVRVTMPKVRSSYRDNLVLSYAVVYYRSEGQWRPLTSGAWAYSYTLNHGWNSQWFFWSNGHGAISWNWNVTHGYEYAVQVVVGDAQDGHQTQIWARTHTGSSTCRA